MIKHHFGAICIAIAIILAAVIYCAMWYYDIREQNERQRMEFMMRR